MPRYNEYLMLNPNDPTEVLGEVTSKKIQKDMNMNNFQFRSWLSRGGMYKGCVLVEKYFDEDPREKKQFDQLVLTSNSGKRYYATSDCCIYVIYKNRKRKDLSLYQKKGHGNQFFVKIDGKEESAIRIFAKAFLGLKPNQVCYLQGKLSLENIKIYSKQDLARKTGKMAKSIPVGLFINKKKVNEWISARDAAKDLYISNQTVCDYCNQKTKKPLYDLRWLV
jgi:hypothetical protein